MDYSITDHYNQPTNEERAQIKRLLDNEVYMRANMLIESVLNEMPQGESRYDQEDYNDYLNAIDDYTHFFKDCRFEPMQWFFVSKYMHEKLAELHEVTFPMRGEYVWARQGMGSALEDDHVFSMMIRGETFPEPTDDDDDDIAC